MNQKYILPVGKGGIAEKFSGLCELQPESYVLDMRKHIKGALDSMASFKDDFIGPDLKLAQELADKCNLLLDRYLSFSDDQKRQVVGAIRYFVMHMDTMPDHTPVVGLEDDVLVLNHVLEKLGLTSECIIY